MWRWFCDLSDRREYQYAVEPGSDKLKGRSVWRKVARPERIGFADIVAWERLNGVTLAPWQLAAVTLLDDRFIEVDASPIVPAPTQDRGVAATVEFMKRHAKPKKRRK